MHLLLKFVYVHVATGFHYTVQDPSHTQILQFTVMKYNFHLFTKSCVTKLHYCLKLLSQYYYTHVFQNNCRVVTETNARVGNIKYCLKKDHKFIQVICNALSIMRQSFILLWKQYTDQQNIFNGSLHYFPSYRTCQSSFLSLQEELMSCNMVLYGLSYSYILYDCTISDSLLKIARLGTSL